MIKCKICGEKAIAKKLCEKHYHEKFRRERYLRYREIEIFKVGVRNKEKRVEMLRKLSPESKCFKCGTGLDFDKKRGAFVSDNKVLCFECWGKDKRIRNFSRHYESCVRCGTTERKHAGHGLCSKCYSTERRVRK